MHCFPISKVVEWRKEEQKPSNHPLPSYASSKQVDSKQKSSNSWPSHLHVSIILIHLGKIWIICFFVYIWFIFNLICVCINVIKSTSFFICILPNTKLMQNWWERDELNTSLIFRFKSEGLVNNPILCRQGI